MTTYKILPTLSLAAPLAIFGYIASEVTEHKPLPPDSSILNFMFSHATGSLSSFFLFFTNAGSIVGMSILVTVLSALFVYKKHITGSYLVLSSVLFAGLINYLLKQIFQRTRPDMWKSFVVEYNYSFPSGHAMASSALAFALITLTWHTKYKWPVLISSALFMFFVGLSRVYFGVHFPSDILAGWLVSLVIVLVLYFVIFKKFFRF